MIQGDSGMTPIAVVVSALLLLGAASVSAQMQELGRWNRGRLVDRDDRAQLRFEQRSERREELRQRREERLQEMRDRLRERQEYRRDMHEFRHEFRNRAN
jgi:Skp family chaperone for outer membrane proteins